MECRAYTKWMLRCWAVLHVEFLRGMNDNREEALSKVANAYGVEPLTIEAWVSRIPKKWKGVRTVREMKAAARKKGEVARCIMVSGADIGQNDYHINKMIMSEWGDDALTRRGNEFQQAHWGAVDLMIRPP